MEEFLSAEQAAALWRHVCGEAKYLCRVPSAWTIRELCKAGELQELGVKVTRTGERVWGIKEDDLLRVMRDNLAAALERAEKELADG